MTAVLTCPDLSPDQISLVSHNLYAGSDIECDEACVVVVEAHHTITFSYHYLYFVPLTLCKLTKPKI